MYSYMLPSLRACKKSYLNIIRKNNMVWIRENGENEKKNKNKEHLWNNINMFL